MIERTSLYGVEALSCLSVQLDEMKYYRMEIVLANKNQLFNYKTFVQHV